MERRSISNPVKIETRGEGDEKKTVITGTGIVYYDDSNPGTEYRLWGETVERIKPGAFDRAIKEDDIRGLFNHDPSQVLGRTKSGTMRLAATDDGVTYEIDEADTTVFRDVSEHIKRGDVTGASFAFRVTDERWFEEDGKEVREILAGEMADIGPVTYPAYTATDATVAARSEGHVTDARESYALWKDEQAHERNEQEAMELRFRITEAELDT